MGNTTNDRVYEIIHAIATNSSVKSENRKDYLQAQIDGLMYTRPPGWRAEIERLQKQKKEYDY